jgi:hypothetical protein
MDIKQKRNLKKISIILIIRENKQKVIQNLQEEKEII